MGDLYVLPSHAHVQTCQVHHGILHPVSLSVFLLNYLLYSGIPSRNNLFCLGGLTMKLGCMPSVTSSPPFDAL